MGQYMTAAEAAAEREENPPSTFPGGGAYLGAALFPLLGVIFAIVAFGKGKVGPGFALVLTSVVSWFGWLLILAGLASS